MALSFKVAGQREHDVLLAPFRLVRLAISFDQHPLRDRLFDGNFFQRLVSQADRDGSGPGTRLGAADLLEAKDDHLPDRAVVPHLWRVCLVVVAIPKLPDVLQLRSVRFEEMELTSFDLVVSNRAVALHHLLIVDLALAGVVEVSVVAPAAVVDVSVRLARAPER